MLKVKLFAGLAEDAGRRTLELPVDGNITVEELKFRLAGEYPGLKGKFEKCMVAVNQEYAEPDTPISAADEVVFIPPVSGG